MRGVGFREPRASFETPAMRAPQDEVFSHWYQKDNLILRSAQRARLEGCSTRLLRGGGGAAQFGGVVAAGEERFDVARRLAQALAVLDQRDAHKPLAVLAEADPRRDRDIGPLEQELREGERADRAEFR